MKTAKTSRDQACGMALIPALMITGMVAIVVVLFFSLASMQQRSSASHMAIHELGSLQDMAVNTALGQLRQGTLESGTLWTSQPGALRTYHLTTGEAAHVYKLYTAKDMVVTGASLTTPALKNLETDVPANWNSLPAIYADLNEPSLNANGKITFPVIDPRAMDMINPTYPTSETPEGFSYTDKLAVSETLVTGVYMPGGSPSASNAAVQRLPMPVRWVYILRDGSMGVLEHTGASTNFLPFQNQNSASAANPIVGRIAFWTDDESTKININTASEGLFWDTPRAATNEEIAFAKQPPVRNEVQRYGGHPATTSLSTVLFPGERLLPGTHLTQLRQIYDMAPKINDDGGIMAGNISPVTMKTSDHLYASVDEYLLQSDRTEHSLFTGDSERLNRLRFLLTAESRSPEITAAGMPRVSIWPVSYRPEPAQNKRTSFDNVSAFASTLGNHPYHFRRNSAASNMDDFSNYYNAEATDSFGWGMIHNNYLAQYLIESTKIATQGYSKSLAEKYDQRYGSPSSKAFNIGTGIVDILEYIRQTNTDDTTHSTKSVNPRVPVDAFAQANANWIGTDTIGQVAAVDMSYYSSPLNDSNKVLKRDTNDDGDDRVWTTGVGREYTVSEVGLVFILAADHPSSGDLYNADLATKLNLQRGTKAIQVGLIAEGFCASQGYTMIAPSTSFRADWLDHIRITTDAYGTREAGGKIADPTVDKLAQEFGTAPDTSAPGYTWPPIRERTLEAWRRWGRILHNPSHLQYLSAIKPVESPIPTGRNTTGNWWIGWGGSGGYWMYTDSNANGHSQVAEIGTDPDFDTATRSYPTHYSRGYFLVPSNATSMTISSARTGSLVERCIEVKVGNQRDGDFSSRRLFIEIPNNMVVPVPGVQDDLAPTFGRRYENARTSGGNRFKAPEIIDGQDVVRTWVVRHGDYRLAYIRAREGGNAAGIKAEKRLFTPHPSWDPDLGSGTQTIKQIHAFTKAGGKPHTTGVDGGDRYAPIFGNATISGISSGTYYHPDYRPDFPVDPTSAKFRANVPSNYPYSVNPADTRDWDNGTGIAPDGAYWNKPDDIARVYEGAIPPYFTASPWDGININSRPTNQTTAPNQLIPSAVMFGSIPSAASTGLQWTTYLFRPDITPGGHLGSANHSTQGTMSGAPPDHTLLDLFWMPVVQPYAISEPFSTAGKINMNYRIAPFTNITRATGLHAVLKSEQILAIPSDKASTYKTYTSASSNGSWRHYIDAKQTLLQWEDKFNAGTFFKNASEICEQFLVPAGDGINATSAVRTQMSTYWNNHRLTGDNVLERPYANIYPRLTTRSNTYRIHFKVQTIAKARSTDADTFDPEKDSITGETQGDALVERAIDPNDPDLSKAEYDYISKARNGTLSTATSLDKLYFWRIRNTRHFMR